MVNEIEKVSGNISPFEHIRRGSELLRTLGEAK